MLASTSLVYSVEIVKNRREIEIVKKGKMHKTDKRTVYAPRQFDDGNY